MILSDEEVALVIEALEVAATDASHYGEYGGDSENIKRYRDLAEKLRGSQPDTDPAA